MKTKNSWFLAVFLCITFFASGAEAADWFAAEASAGYDFSDNVIYAPIVSKEGEDYILKQKFKFSLNPKIVEWFSAKATYYLDMYEYSVRPEYNSNGQTGEIELEWNPFGVHFFYMTLASASYNIGAKTPYYSKSSEIQYIFDITGSGQFWTTAYYEKNEEGYNSSFYEPLNNTNAVIGIRQFITEYFYFLFEATDLTASAPELSFDQAFAEAVSRHTGIFSIDFSLGVSLKARDYKGSYDILTPKKREDRETSVFFSATKEILPSLSLTGTYSLTKNDCNLPKEKTLQGYADYTENVAGFYLTLKI